MASIVIDLDGTLTIEDKGADYAARKPNLPVIARLREYKAAGFQIKIVTSRNMRTHAGNVGLINVHTLPGIAEWLNRHEVPFDEIHVGKPWCETGGFYVDDKSVRPDEFAQLDYAGIQKLISRGEDGNL